MRFVGAFSASKAKVDCSPRGCLGHIGILGISRVSSDGVGGDINVQVPRPWLVSDGYR
jgi:hypothetical protein